ATTFTAVELGLAGTTITTGDFITATASCNTTGGDTFSPCSSTTPSAAGKTQDVAGNVMQSAQTVTGTAIGDSTKPSISSTTTVNGTTLRLTYTEPVTCNGVGTAPFTIT